MQGQSTHLVVQSGGEVLAWDVRGWNLVLHLAAGDQPVRILDVGALDGYPVVLTAIGHQLQIHAAQDGVPLWTMDTGEQWVRAAAIGTFNDQPIVAFADQYGVVHVWNIEDRAEVRRFGDEPLDRRPEVVGDEPLDGLLEWFDKEPLALEQFGEELPEGLLERLSPLMHPNRSATALAVDQLDGETVVFIVCDDSSLTAWDIESGHQLYRRYPAAVSWPAIRSLQLSRVGAQQVLLLARSADVIVTEAIRGDQVSVVDYAEPEPDEPQVSDVYENAIVNRQHSGVVRAVSFGPNGGLLASASKDRSVQLWNPGTGLAELRLEGHTDWVNAVALGTIGGSYVALSGGTDCEARLWNLDTGASMRVLTGHTGWIRAVALVALGVVPSASLLLTTARRGRGTWSPESACRRFQLPAAR